jgi:signal transduction histidine kinase
MPQGQVPGHTARRIGWPGYALIVAFWTFFGVLMLPRTGSATPTAVMVFTFLGAYVWAGLTLPLFRVTERFNLTSDQGSWRALRVAGLLAFGLVLAVGVSMAIAFTLALLFQDQLEGNLAGTGGAWVMLRYRLAHDVLACQLVLTAGVARDYFFRYRSRVAETTLLHHQLAEARLEVLRAQLNPHFLFNTLNSVAALVQEDPRGVRRMIALLSDLLRQTLHRTSEPEIPLDRELEMLGRYMEIMEIRFRGTLETRVSVDPNTLDALVPNLILQPLVENALKHGVGRAPGSGRVEVSASRDGTDLVLTVRDSGAPEDAPSSHDAPRVEAETHGNGREGGFGLRQTRERLRQLYGDAAALQLRSSAWGGTVAEIRLPYHRAEDASTRPGASGEGADRAAVGAALGVTVGSGAAAS